MLGKGINPNRYRGYCFTVNNYTDKDIDKLEELEMKYRYLIVGKEMGESGTPHLQGFIYYINKKTFEQVKADLGKRAHVEMMRGTPEQAALYCKKDGQYIESGKVPKKGDRSDLTKIRDRLKLGDPLNVVALRCKNYQQIRFAEVYAKYTGKPDYFAPKKIVYWIYGKTGTGKTKLAIDIMESIYQHNLEYCVWMSSGSLKWWQGYWGQHGVILDEFRGSHCELNYLLRVLDRYPMTVESKGSSAWLQARIIIITSCLPPDELYKGCGENIGQLERRITRIECLERKIAKAIASDYIYYAPLAYNAHWNEFQYEVEDSLAAKYKPSADTKNLSSKMQKM